MSDMTVVQLVAAQRGRELRTDGQLGIWDCLAIPVFGVVLAFLIVWLILAGIVTLICSLVCPANNLRKG
jgi:uncharacterized membrane protein